MHQYIDAFLKGSAGADISEMCQHEAAAHDPYCKNGGRLHAQDRKYDYASCSHCDCTGGWTGPDCSCEFSTTAVLQPCAMMLMLLVIQYVLCAAFTPAEVLEIAQEVAVEGQ